MYISKTPYFRLLRFNSDYHKICKPYYSFWSRGTLGWGTAKTWDLMVNNQVKLRFACIYVGYNHFRESIQTLAKPTKPTGKLWGSSINANMINQVVGLFVLVNALGLVAASTPSVNSGTVVLFRRGSRLYCIALYSWVVAALEPLDSQDLRMRIAKDTSVFVLQSTCRSSRKLSSRKQQKRAVSRATSHWPETDIR